MEDTYTFESLFSSNPVTNKENKSSKAKKTENKESNNIENNKNSTTSNNAVNKETSNINSILLNKFMRNNATSDVGHIDHQTNQPNYNTYLKQKRVLHDTETSFQGEVYHSEFSKKHQYSLGNLNSSGLYSSSLNSQINNQYGQQMGIINNPYNLYMNNMGMYGGNSINNNMYNVNNNITPNIINQSSSNNTNGVNVNSTNNASSGFKVTEGMTVEEFLKNKPTNTNNQGQDNKNTIVIGQIINQQYYNYPNPNNINHSNTNNNFNTFLINNNQAHNKSKNPLNKASSLLDQSSINYNNSNAYNEAFNMQGNSNFINLQEQSVFESSLKKVILDDLNFHEKRKFKILLQKYNMESLKNVQICLLPETQRYEVFKKKYSPELASLSYKQYIDKCFSLCCDLKDLEKIELSIDKVLSGPSGKALYNFKKKWDNIPLPDISKITDFELNKYRNKRNKRCNIRDVYLLDNFLSSKNNASDSEDDNDEENDNISETSNFNRRGNNDNKNDNNDISFNSRTKLYSTLPSTEKLIEIAEKVSNFKNQNSSPIAFSKKEKIISKKGGIIVHESNHKSQKELALIRKQKYDEERRQFEETKKNQAILNGDYNTSLSILTKNQKFVGTNMNLEKQYLRITSLPDPSQVRPENILKKSFELMIKKWKNKLEDYNYLLEQFRSIRQDLTIQNIQNEFTVKVYESNARLAIENKDLDQFNQCQSQLILLYKKKIKGCETEFSSYRIIYNSLIQSQTYDSINLIKEIHQSELYSKEEIKNAMEMRKYLNDYNYLQFFKAYKKCYNMGKTLIEPFLPRLRIKALQMIAVGYFSDITIDNLYSKLAYSNHDDFIKFLKENNVKLSADQKKMLCRDSLEVLNNSKHLHVKFAYD